jgi:hypothetical protein
MESTGVANAIQVSQETADLVIAYGKSHWLVQREEKIQAKGKGTMQTFFLDTNKMSKPYTSSPRSTCSASEMSVASGYDVDVAEIEKKRNRSAEWTVEIMAHHLKAMINARKEKKIKPDPREKIGELELASISSFGIDNKSAIDEVAQAIIFPEYKLGWKGTKTADFTELDTVVLDELRNYVQTIASLYNENPFHNFDHATHVAMSVNKLLSRINAPDLVDGTSKDVHDHTYGVGSDPLTWYVTFAFDMKTCHLEVICLTAVFCSSSCLGLPVFLLHSSMMWITQVFPTPNLLRRELRWQSFTGTNLLQNKTPLIWHGIC